MWRGPWQQREAVTLRIGQDGGLPGSGPRRSGEHIAAGRYLLLGVSIVTSALIGGAPVLAQPPQGAPVVRLAELQIDPARLDEYKAALREEIETSIRLEPGVLTLYAVSVKGHPAQIRLFEMYADQAAYEAHLNTPHFLKYKTGTQHMVKSLVLVETDPILLGAKPR
jgi:quinol monooxygenase YgiN